MKSRQCPTSGGGVAHDDRVQCFADGRFERRLPPMVDVDQVKERTDDAVEPGETLGSGPGTRRIESRSERFHPGLPRFGHSVGFPEAFIGRFKRRLSLRQGLLDIDPFLRRLRCRGNPCGLSVTASSVDPWETRVAGDEFEQLVDLRFGFSCIGHQPFEPLLQ